MFCVILNPISTSGALPNVDKDRILAVWSGPVSYNSEFWFYPAEVGLLKEEKWNNK